jgi:uncharacterized protein (TIGR02646 family)
MIRVEKSTNTPKSLLTTKSYNGHDVQRQLLHDQSRKCYICENYVEPNFHIEHINSKANKQDWNNLFLSCGYCNDKKLRMYDDILSPATNNIEDIIEQRLDTYLKEASFFSKFTSQSVEKTIKLLKCVYNGKKQYGNIRSPHEDLFYDKIELLYNDFMRKVINYRLNPSVENEEIIREDLAIDKELLGFKYWIIKDDSNLLKVFANDIIWNKTV